MERLQKENVLPESHPPQLRGDGWGGRPRQRQGRPRHRRRRLRQRRPARLLPDERRSAVAVLPQRQHRERALDRAQAHWDNIEPRRDRRARYAEGWRGVDDARSQRRQWLCQREHTAPPLWPRERDDDFVITNSLAERYCPDSDGANRSHHDG